MESAKKEDKIPFEEHLEETVITTKEEAARWQLPYDGELCGIWVSVRKVKMKNLIIGVVCKYQNGLQNKIYTNY